MRRWDKGVTVKVRKQKTITVRVKRWPTVYLTEEETGLWRSGQRRRVRRRMHSEARERGRPVRFLTSDGVWIGTYCPLDDKTTDFLMKDGWI